MSELKPCPFCGKAPHIHECIGGWLVSCASGDCPVQPELDDFRDTDLSAAKDWNTRPATVPVDELRAFLERRRPGWEPNDYWGEGFRHGLAAVRIWLDEQEKEQQEVDDES